MKTIFLAFVVFRISFSIAVAQNKLSGSFKLNADVTSIKPAYKAYLIYPGSPGVYLYNKDSVLVQNGHFVFNMMLNEPILADLNLLNKNGKSLGSFSLFLEPPVMNITTKDSILNRSVITNSVLCSYNNELIKLMDTYNKPLYNLKAQLRKTDKADYQEITRLEKAIEKIQTGMSDSVYKPYILAHLNDYTSLFALNLYAGAQVNADKVLPLYNQLNKRYQNLPSGIELKRRIEIAQNSTLGQFAPDFIQPDTAGNLVKLSDFKGKYLLLDFWASWCSPCRQESPKMVKLYSRYKDQNFTILSVSCDTHRSNWVKAIKQDHLAWTHVSDLKLANTALDLYNVGSIPQNYLISPEGKIIAKNLHGEELEKKLHELLPN